MPVPSFRGGSATARRELPAAVEFWGGFGDSASRRRRPKMPRARARHNDEMVQHAQGFLSEVRNEIRVSPSATSGHGIAEGRA